MPIYEYIAKDLNEACNYCKQPFEVMQSLDDEELEECPECSNLVKKILSESTFILKGDGWAKEGYSKK